MRSLHDSEVRELLNTGRPGWRWEPTLLTVDGERVRVSTGPAMVARLTAGLGLRRATRVARLARQALAVRTESSEGRRSFLRKAGAGFVALTGLAIGAQGAASASGAPSAGGERMLPMNGVAKTDAVRAARAAEAVRAAERTLAAQGYVAEPSARLAFRLPDNGRLVYLFYESQDDPNGSAGFVGVELAADGQTLTTASTLSGSSANLDAVTATRLGTEGELAPMGPQHYFSCMGICLGATCGPTALRFCRAIPHLAASLACMVGYCGWKTYPCHNQCKAFW
ncbi:MAG: hypothetical protein LC635_04285 [Pseudonocardiaceae bacterium]|nr:hypothetical protein [Pseudonocardiaceae bacterium]